MQALDLDWELGLFNALRALYRAVAPEPPPPYDQARAATLGDVEGRLRVVAQALSGSPVRLVEARREGGVRGLDLLLPPWIDLGCDVEANRALYLVRVAVAAAVHRARVDVPDDPVDNLVASLDAALDAAQALSEDLALFGPAWSEACLLVLSRRPAEDLVGRAAVEEAWKRAALLGQRPWADPEQVARLRALPDKGPPSPPVELWGRLLPRLDADPGKDPGAEGAPVSSPATEAQAPPVEALELATLAQEDNRQLPMHLFEKVETVEAFSGTAREADGSDELDDHLEALQEVDLGVLLRGGEQARSLLRAEVGLDVDIPDVGNEQPGERSVAYDEWDHRRHAYRTDWCRVLPTAMGRGSGDWASAALQRQARNIDELQRRLANHRAARQAANRQLSGEEVDIDALVDAWSSVRAGHTPDPRLYVARRPQRRDVATTVLLDISLSADSWVEDRRVLDVAREAALVLGEVADRLGDALQVLAFASHTRNRIRVWTVRDWHEPWAVGRGRLGLLRPQGYTRIGPALRHAAAGLARVPARQRLVLLISDGKPTDYDRYEGRYGIADVRQAIREAGDQGVRVHALALDAVSRAWLPSMLGPGNWHVMRHPDQLPVAATTLYGRLS